MDATANFHVKLARAYKSNGKDGEASKAAGVAAMRQALVDCRERTGKNIAAAVKAGKVIVREVSYNERGTAKLTDLTGWVTPTDAAKFLRGYAGIRRLADRRGQKDA